MATARREILLVGVAVAALTGCRHVGPRTITDDRLAYNHSIVSSWKQQTLLNIVRLRYSDVPEFVDVPSIVNGYESSRTSSVGLGAELYPQDAVSTFWSPELRHERSMVDRPTISYAPQTGSEFTRNLTNPIPPTSILNLIESGYPADIVMELAVSSINGVRNRGFAGGYEKGDPEFRQALQILRKAQASGNVSLRVVPAADKSNTDVVLGIRSENIPAPEAEEIEQMRKLLRLDPTVHEFKIVFGMLPKDKTEIAFRTRSIFGILTFLMMEVQVPPSHLAEGRAPELGDTTSPTAPLLTILSGPEQPCDVYSAVCYQGFWFWIDQRDFNSKRTFLYLKILLALADTRLKDAGPALTIRAN